MTLDELCWDLAQERLTEECEVENEVELMIYHDMMEWMNKFANEKHRMPSKREWANKVKKIKSKYAKYLYGKLEYIRKDKEDREQVFIKKYV